MLIIPDSFNSQFDFTHFDKNLSILYEAQCLKQVTTEQALRAFEEYKANQITLADRLKKTTATVISYGVPITVVCLTVCTAAYQITKMIVNHDFIATVLNNTPLLPATSLPVVDALIPYTTPGSLVATFGAFATLDVGSKRIIGIAPLRGAIGISLGLLMTIPLVASSAFSRMVNDLYEENERKKEGISKKSHKEILDQNRAVYDHVAQGFSLKYNKIVDNPKEIFKLKVLIDCLFNKYPVFKSGLAKLDLSALEIDQVLSKLTSIIKEIKNYAFEFRSPGKKYQNGVDVNCYNAEILALMPYEEIGVNAIPTEVKNSLNIVKANTIGIYHIEKSYATAVITGTFKGLGTVVGMVTVLTASAYVVYPQTLEILRSCVSSCVNGESLFSTACLMSSLAPLLAVPFAYKLGKGKFNETLDFYNRQREVCNLKKDKHRNSAIKKLEQLYRGIALHYQTRFQSVEPLDRVKLGTEVRAILEKLPQINQAIAKTKIVETPEIITEPLNVILQSIRMT